MMMIVTLKVFQFGVLGRYCWIRERSKHLAKAGGDIRMTEMRMEMRMTVLLGAGGEQALNGHVKTKKLLKRV